MSLLDAITDFMLGSKKRATKRTKRVNAAKSKSSRPRTSGHYVKGSGTRKKSKRREDEKHGEGIVLVKRRAQAGQGGESKATVMRRLMRELEREGVGRVSRGRRSKTRVHRGLAKRFSDVAQPSIAAMAKAEERMLRKLPKSIVSETEARQYMQCFQRWVGKFGSERAHKACASAVFDAARVRTGRVPQGLTEGHVFEPEGESTAKCIKRLTSEGHTVKKAEKICAERGWTQFWGSE